MQEDCTCSARAARKQLRGGRAEGQTGRSGRVPTTAPAREVATKGLFSVAGASTVAAAALVAAASLTIPAVAQTALPGIVVEGATLAPPRRAPTAPAAPAREAGPSAPAAGPAEGGSPPAGAGEPPAAPIAATGAATTDEAAGTVAAGPGAAATGAAVTVVTGEQLRAQQVRHAAEALRSLPGVHVSRGGGFGAQTQVRIRGGEANHTLVLIDGIVANDTNNGAFDFSDLSAESIERIEVIRGPQSGLYGSNALGGVINIVTKSGRGPLQVTARAEGGSFRTFDHAISASGGTDRAWGAVTYHERHSTGFDVSPIGRERDGHQLKTVIGRGGVKIVDGVTLDFTMRYSEKKGDRDTEGGPVGTLAVQVDDPSKFESTVFLGGANLRWDMAGGALTHILRVSRNETVTFDRSPSFTSNNVSETVKYGYLGTWRFETPALLQTAHTLTALVEEEREGFLPLSDFSDGLERSRARLATALEWTATIAGRLALAANVRHDDNDRTRDFTTWRTSASLRLPEWGLRPHASIGTGVKLPTMFEQFGSIPSFFTPNPNLRPETSEGWDAGLEVTLWQGRAVLDATYFAQTLTDRIDGFVPGPGFTFTAENRAGVSHREGVELSARLQLMPSLLLTAAYTHLIARDADGREEIRRPKDSGRADLVWRFDRRGTATLGVLYNGAMQDTAFRIDGYFFGFPFTTPARTTLDAYWLVNATARYEVLPGVEVYGRVENALDSRYYEIYGFATPGVAAYAGVKLSWGGEGR